VNPSRSRHLLALQLCVAQAALFLAGCRPPAAATATADRNLKLPLDARSSGGLHANIVTDKGTIVIEFFPSDAPRAVENFRLLAEHGYYDGLTIHRIVTDFMIQGGDPAGDGSGGNSAWGGTFADEIQKDSPRYKTGYVRGIVAMANAGPNTNSSQFFIMLKDYPLPPIYVIFGKVTGGMDVVDALGSTPVVPGPDGENSKPVRPPVFRKVTISP
jgi:cyclophilin family peptidyl-prolyl cis-trans isomerase